MGFILDNLGTIIVGALVLALVVFLVVKMVKDGKGTDGCGCGCSGCPRAGLCEASKEKDEDSLK